MILICGLLLSVENKGLIIVDLSSILTIFWLLFIFGGIAWLVRQMRTHKREFSASLKGAIAIVEMDNGNNIMKLDYASKVYGIDKLTLQGVVLGRAVSQRDSQARIELAGDWERVNENTVKGVVDTFKGRDHGKYPSRTEWVLTLGESFTLGFVAGRGVKYIKASSSQAKIVGLYVSEDAPITYSK